MNVRFTATEMALIEEWSKRCDVPASELVRTAVLGAIRQGLIYRRIVELVDGTDDGKGGGSTV